MGLKTYSNPCNWHTHRCQNDEAHLPPCRGPLHLQLGKVLALRAGQGLTRWHVLGVYTGSASIIGEGLPPAPDQPWRWASWTGRGTTASRWSCGCCRTGSRSTRPACGATAGWCTSPWATCTAPAACTRTVQLLKLGFNRECFWSRTCKVYRFFFLQYLHIPGK